MRSIKPLVVLLGLIFSGCSTVKVQTPKIVLVKQLQSVIAPTGSINRVPQDVGFVWSPPPEPDASQVVAYNLYYGTESHCYRNKIHLDNVTNGVTPSLLGGITYYIAVTDQDVDGNESNFSKEANYTPPLVMDLMFAFDQPVSNVVLQVSPDLIQWQDFGAIPTNGVWRVTANPSAPVGFFRGKATTQ